VNVFNKPLPKIGDLVNIGPTGFFYNDEWCFTYNAISSNSFKVRFSKPSLAIVLEINYHPSNGAESVEHSQYKLLAGDGSIIYTKPRHYHMGLKER
jgi:hypothetical protein